MARPRPVRILYGVAAGFGVLGSGLPALTPERYDWIGPAVGLTGLAILAGLAKVTEDKVTPLSDPRDAAGRALVPRRDE